MTTAAEMRDALLDRAVWHLRPKHARVNFRASLARDIDALIAQVEAETRAKACEMHETIIENYADSLRLLNDDYQVEAETRAGLASVEALEQALHRAEIDCWPDVDGCAASGHRGAAYRLHAALAAPEPSSGAAPVEVKRKHDEYHSDPPDDFDVWCVAPCHDEGDCDGLCHPDCETCPVECPLCPPFAPRSAGAGGGRTDQ